jgi:hypothetical protein
MLIGGSTQWTLPLLLLEIEINRSLFFREEKPHGDDTHSLLELFLERRCTRHRAI